MIEVRSLSVRAGSKTIVDSIDLEAGAGRWLGLIGPNGAGKTTILKGIAGLVETGGVVSIGGEKTSEVRRMARLVGFVPQRPEIPGTMKVIDYVMLGRSPHIGYFGLESPADISAVERALHDLVITGLAGRRLGTLSGGELQRVVLARVVAQETPVVLLDEPTASLDMGSAQQVLGVIDRLRGERNLTVITALHDLTLAAQFCDRLVLVSGGRIVASGVAETVLTESAIKLHYGATVRILKDDHGGVVVIPLRSPREPAPSIAGSFPSTHRNEMSS